MKIYFAGLAGGLLKGEKNLINKFSVLDRLFSYYFIKDNEFSNMDIFNIWIKRKKDDNNYKRI